jgi:hypothetical protein
MERYPVLTGHKTLLKWQYFPNLYTDFVDPYEIQTGFTDIHKLILKFIWKCKGPKIVTLPHFQGIQKL